MVIKGYEELQCSCCGETYYKRKCALSSLVNKNNFLNREHRARFFDNDKQLKKLSFNEKNKRKLWYVGSNGFTDKQLKEQVSKPEDGVEQLIEEYLSAKSQGLPHTKTLESLKKIVASRGRGRKAL